MQNIRLTPPAPFVQSERMKKVETSSRVGSKLQDWLHGQRMTRCVLAQKLEVYPSNVTRWIAGDTKPNDALRLQIRKMTRGHITLDDWATE